MKRNEQELRARMRQIVDDEILMRPRRWMYLSFATEKEFLGAIYIEAHGIASAVAKANVLGISPGGQVWGVDIPDVSLLPPPEYREKLLSKEQLREAQPGEDFHTLAEFDKEENDGKK
jgi:hypothetical protein